MPLHPDCRKFISRLPSDYAKRLFYDTCAFGASALKFAVQEVGAGQILLGTDDPFIGADIDHVNGLSLAEADRTSILGGNAARLFGL